MNCGGKKKKSANSPVGTNKSKLGAPKEKKDETEQPSASVKGESLKKKKNKRMKMTTRRSGNPTAIANEPIPWQNLKIKIYKHLGSGVMGSVFLIDWQKSKKVALKLVPLTQNSSWHLCKVEVDNLIKIRQISSEVPNFVKMLNNCIVESIPAEVCKKFQLLQNTKYSVIILENGGEPLAKKIFKSDEQIISAVAQTMLAMCVAKRRLDFQHVDIHDKNILVSETESEIMEYVVDGRKVRVRACGVKVTIIDLQLSRFKYYPSRYDLRRLCDVFIMLAKKTNEESARKIILKAVEICRNAPDSAGLWPNDQFFDHTCR